MSEKHLRIDEEKCLRCGLCVSDCVMRSLELPPDGVVGFGENGELRCIGCQHCLAICPVGALSIFDRDPAASGAVSPLPTAADLDRLIRNRRSMRQYRTAALPRAEVESLLALMAWVPTGVNDHRLHFTVSMSRERTDYFRTELTRRFLAAIDAGTLSPALEGMRGFEKALRKGADVFFRTAPHFVMVSAPVDSPCPGADPVIALSYFELAAAARGIGTTWCGLVLQLLLHLAPDLLKEMRLPKGYRPGYVMLFGRPAVHYARLTQPAPVTVAEV